MRGRGGQAVLAVRGANLTAPSSVTASGRATFPLEGGRLFSHPYPQCIEQTHKKTAPDEPALFFWSLALGDSAHGAGTSAGAAIDAGAGVDDVVVVALSDSAHGAALSAGTAADASVTNNIGHDMYTSIKMVLSILAHFFKKAMLNFWSFKFFAETYPDGSAGYTCTCPADVPQPGGAAVSKPAKNRA